jgi:putative tricarboxylic transport membrane protein
MQNSKISGALPYVIVLLVAVFFYYKAMQFDFEAPEGRLGPDAWPRIVLGLLALVCVYEIVRRFFFDAAKTLQSDAPHSTEATPSCDSSTSDEENEPSYPWLLSLGIVMTIGYVALLGTLGFFLCTALYLAGFIVLGGYRRIGVTLAVSLLGSFVFMFIFMKIVYVSLPLGSEPFSYVSFLLIRLMGIH